MASVPQAPNTTLFQAVCDSAKLASELSDQLELQLKEQKLMHSLKRNTFPALKELYTSNKVLRTKYDSVLTKLNDLSENFKTNNNNVTDIQETICDRKTGMNALQSTVDKLKTKMDTLQKNDDELKTKMDTLQKMMMSLKLKWIPFKQLLKILGHYLLNISKLLKIRIG